MHQTFLLTLVIALIGLYVLSYTFGLTKIYIHFILKRIHSDRQGIRLGMSTLLIGSFTTWLIYNTQNKTYNHLKHVYNNKQYELVQGNIENLHATYNDIHHPETFTVDSVEFNVNADNTDGYGFNTELKANYDLKPNMLARIAYYNNGYKNVILKFEIEK